MISSVLVVAMAVSVQPTDTTRASREAFTGCLRTYVERVTQNRLPPAEFATAYPQQCTTQQTAFRDAIIRRERASRMSQADAEESATTEIDDARLNFRERYEMALGPVPTNTQTASTPAPAATPAATPAAVTTPATTPAATPAPTPAAQTTTPH